MKMKYFLFAKLFSPSLVPKLDENLGSAFACEYDLSRLRFIWLTYAGLLQILD